MNYTREIKKMDPNLRKDDPSFLVARILLCAADRGNSMRTLCTYLHRPVKDLRPYVNNLKAQKVFDGRRIRHSGWFNKKTGGVAFWLDVAIGQGYIARVKK